MILPVEAWMDLRRYKPLRDAGATWREIADEVGLDWRTVKRYLSSDTSGGPPVAPSRRGTVARKIDALAPVVDAWLAADPRLKASVVHERLVAEHGFDGHYQRVKLYVAEARERLARDGDADSGLNGLHRRFEVVAGAQAQVDWGDEGAVLLEHGVVKVYSFHMTLSYSRDPFCCFTTSQDLGTFFDCHRRGFAHFGGVPGAIVYDRTKTVVKRHVAPREAVPLHPEAAAFAEHYGFVIDVLAAYRPTGKGRVERQVAIVRDHVLAGREFGSVAELDGAFNQWVPIRRAQRHRTHGELIGVRAEVDRAALGPLPELPYLVCDRHLRRVGRDCWSASRARTTRCPPAPPTAARRGPDSGSSCGSAPARSPSTASPSTVTRSCWPPIPARPTAAPWWSIPRTGRGCPTDTPGRSPSTHQPSRSTPTPTSSPEPSRDVTRSPG